MSRDRHDHEAALWEDVQRQYEEFRREAIAIYLRALTENHDPGDEDRR